MGGIALTVETYIKGIEEIYQENPGYERGHDGSDGLCDCIGMVKGAIRRGGETPKGLKGTNWAARYTIKNMSRIERIKDLHIGDVVLKAIEPGGNGYDLPDEYKAGGASYNGDLQDYSHIGTVTSVDPLEITHMASPSPKKDNKLGKWKYFGQLPQVSGEQPGPDPDPDPPVPVEETAKVWAAQGSTVNMRKGPSTSKALVERVPIGWTVTVLDKEPDWCQIKYTDKRGATWYGWMMTQFLVFDDEPQTDLWTVHVLHLNTEEAESLMMDYAEAYKTQE